jgi:hypothetical protein
MVVTPAINAPNVVHAMRMREADGSLHVDRAELAQVLAADMLGRALAVGDSVAIYRRINEDRWGFWHNERRQVGKVVQITGWDEITVEVAGASRRMSSNDVEKAVG